MKQALGIIAAIAFSLYTVFLWGRLFLDTLMHPIQALKFSLPFWAVLLLVWLVIHARDAQRKAQLNSQVEKSMQAKSAKEQLEISLNEDKQWSDVAVDAARKSFKARGLAAQVEAVADFRSTRF